MSDDVKTAEAEVEQLLEERAELARGHKATAEVEGKIGRAVVKLEEARAAAAEGDRFRQATRSTVEYSL